MMGSSSTSGVSGYYRTKITTASQVFQMTMDSRQVPVNSEVNKDEIVKKESKEKACALMRKMYQDSSFLNQDDWIFLKNST